MRKPAIAIFLTILLTNIIIAQEKPNNWIGFNTSISIGELIRYGGALEGGTGYNGQIGFLIGIGFIRTINETFDLETKLDFSRNLFETSYIDAMGQTIRGVNPEHVDLLTIPLNLRIKLRKNFVITSGIQYDQRFNVIDYCTIDNQTCIGINLKIGKDFKLSNKMIVSLAPEIIIHDIIPFSPEKHQQRLTELGLRINYRIGI